MRTADFTYELPEQAIAQTPVEPRDAARLLRTSDLSDHEFRELPGLLEPGDLVVLNDTRVRAARLKGRRQPSGGAVELLLLERRPDETWEALVRPARKLKAGSLVDIDGITAEVLTDPDDGIVQITLTPAADLEDAIEKSGEMPLPPYITTPLDRPDRYQTVYARATGSAAAPTAGLHFTDRVLAGLAERGIGVARIELRVGLGTFRPITAERVEDHVMHRETYVLGSGTIEAISQTRDRGGSIVAIGTTTVRALESAWLSDHPQPGEAATDLFITPGFEFRVVDRLVTNFHLPGSTLICMVAAFMGKGWRETYGTALDRGYRFLSFGDAMLADRFAR
ncbi:MAG TPA: tRNA preQ1(34) S-adenosylmethionine ribosyltransferase-isomerase QueA [Acidimicrobiia bacterium]|nr:tRNA preQ1(34) S-adenosylmethionine ribosyltransferase-isomerase QueA [Acidimicrobiia bacterium]